MYESNNKKINAICLNRAKINVKIVYLRLVDENKEKME